MKLYLVQHAKAASKEVDPQRPLTEEGLREIQKVAQFIKPSNLCVDYLWHSGKKRAVQTAEVLSAVIKVNKTLTGHDGLGPMDDVTALANELASATQDIMIVGHLPFLAKLASLLLTGSESTDTVAFKQGGIVCLSCCDENKWQIDWMVTPEILVD
ncbi:MAG: phosphohistidine phosphatase SixA [Sedimentisphaerales bacterium]